MGTIAERVRTTLAVLVVLVLASLPLALGMTASPWGGLWSSAGGSVDDRLGYLQITGIMMTMQLLCSAAIFFIARGVDHSADSGRLSRGSLGVYLALVGLAASLWVAWALATETTTHSPTRTEGHMVHVATLLVLLSGGAMGYAGHVRTVRNRTAARAHGTWRHAAAVVFWWMCFPLLFSLYLAVGLGLEYLRPHGTLNWLIPAALVPPAYIALASCLAKWLRC